MANMEEYMRKALLTTVLCMLLSGAFALGSPGTSVPVTNNDLNSSLSIAKQQGSELWQIADGTAQPLAQPGNVNTESARTEYNLQIEVMPDGQIHLNWNDIADATGYKVYHCAYPAPTLGEAPWEFWETANSEYFFYPTEADYLNLGFFYVTAITPPPVPTGFVYVPGGTFTMGDTRGGGLDNELPTHSVTLNSFYIGKYELTQAEYSQYLQPGSSWTSNDGLGNNYPAYYVSWYAILKYCNLRSMDEGLTPVYSISGSTNPAAWGTVPTSYNSTWNAAICNWSANGYRLPTEAEWEYAARGATNNPDYLYSGSDDVGTVAWYEGNNSTYGSKPVGTKGPNGIGTYDMSGNLWEWCWDWYSGYSSSPSSNPTGPTSGTGRIGRSGRWSNSANSCRVAYRLYINPYSSDYGVGFRVCRAGL